jgi:hypothetical protein
LSGFRGKSASGLQKKMLAPQEIAMLATASRGIFGLNHACNTLLTMFLLGGAHPLQSGPKA